MASRKNHAPFALLLTLLLGGCMMHEPAGIVYSCIPVDVVQIGPGPDETDVPLDEDITVTFTVPMDSSSFDSSSLVLLLGDEVVEGEVFFDPGDETLTFDPTDSLLPDTVYTVNLTTEFTDSLGFTLDTVYTWTFTTEDTIPPPLDPPDGIGDIYPEDGEKDFPVDGEVTIIFDYPVDTSFFDDSTTFVVKLGDDTIPGDIQYYPEDTTVVFTPDDDFIPDTTYTVTVKYPVDDPPGPLGPPPDTVYTWTFETEDPPPPIEDPHPRPGPVLIQQGSEFDFSNYNQPTWRVYWFRLADAITYRIQISRSPLFVTIVYDQAGIAQNSPNVFQPIPVSILTPGTYYWRVNAVVPGATTLWSAVKTFTVVP
jgi:hypothetical protein